MSPLVHLCFFCFGKVKLMVTFLLIAMFLHGHWSDVNVSLQTAFVALSHHFSHISEIFLCFYFSTTWPVLMREASQDIRTNYTVWKKIIYKVILKVAATFCGACQNPPLSWLFQTIPLPSSFLDPAETSQSPNFTLPSFACCSVKYTDWHAALFGHQSQVRLLWPSKEPHIFHFHFMLH